MQSKSENQLSNNTLYKGILIGLSLGLLSVALGINQGIFGREYPLFTLSFIAAPSIIFLAFTILLMQSEIKDPYHYKIIARSSFLGSGLLATIMFSVILMPGVGVDESVLTMLLASGVGAAGGFMFGFRDVKQLQARQELLDSERERLEFLDSLLRHNVLNNLNVIQGYSSMLKKQTDNQGNSQKLESIQERCESLVGLVDEVSMMVDLEANVPDPITVNLSKCVSQEVERIQEEYPNIILTSHLGEGIHIKGNRMVHLVFQNVLRNAVQHANHDHPIVTIRSSTTDKTVTVTIEDNGPGIPEDQKDSLFDREQQSDGTYQFGLYLVQVCMQYFGGEVKAEDRDNGGTRIVLEFIRVEN